MYVNFVLKCSFKNRFSGKVNLLSMNRKLTSLNFYNSRHLVLQLKLFWMRVWNILLESYRFADTNSCHEWITYVSVQRPLKHKLHTWCVLEWQGKLRGWLYLLWGIILLTDWFKDVDLCVGPWTSACVALQDCMLW